MVGGRGRLVFFKCINPVIMYDMIVRIFYHVLINLLLLINIFVTTM